MGHPERMLTSEFEKFKIFYSRKTLLELYLKKLPKADLASVLLYNIIPYIIIYIHMHKIFSLVL